MTSNSRAIGVSRLRSPANFQRKDSLSGCQINDLGRMQLLREPTSPNTIFHSDVTIVNQTTHKLGARVEFLQHCQSCGSTNSSLFSASNCSAALSIGGRMGDLSKADWILSRICGGKVTLGQKGDPQAAFLSF